MRQSVLAAEEPPRPPPPNERVLPELPPPPPNERTVPELPQPIQKKNQSENKLEDDNLFVILNWWKSLIYLVDVGTSFLLSLE